MATFDQLVEQIDSNLDKQRDRGTAFEKMVVAYLKNEPTYKQKFSDVWMLSDVPEKYGIPKKDLGVDIVARDYAGNLTAVQAKYYKGKVGKDTINSFVAEAGKDYYSAGMLVSSTDDWNRNAEAALENNTKPITRIGLSQLRRANFDWQKFSFAKENNLSDKKEKKLRYYQKDAIANSLKYFKEHDRGKLIMAPGTGKTFTSLKIAEALMKDQGKTNFNILYLVPSIQLLSQTLFNWNSDVSDGIHMTSFSVVSDRKANQKKENSDDDLGAKDVGFEPTTNVEELMGNYDQVKKLDLGQNMTVVFSTYQSIDVLHKAQEAGYPEFDLIIADEAHRTTGANKLGEDSAFTEVHSNKNVKGKLRLYQTATPKIYDQNAKRKAEENSIVVSSMDDKEKYGEEIYRLGFGEAVARGYLTDYKVTVLAVSESYINKDMQKMMAADNQLKVDDIGKIIGVWNAMVKRNGVTGEITGAPMKRAIAFTDTIKHSKIISNEFETVVNEYLDTQSTESFSVDVHHVDGGLNALEKEEELDWLADDSIEDNRARVLSNVRFLTEGIDVPNLDGIIFFSPRKSQVDIVQAVGRIMRRAEGKEYGYIILPVVVADEVDPKDALDNDKKYKQVWQVLNALRSTDERFDAEVNKLDLNKKKDGRINFIGVNSSPDGDVTESEGKEIEQNQKPKQLELPLNWKEMQNAFYGKVVQKVGDRRYLEDWSKDVADIAKMYIRRINDLIDSNDGARLAFNKFLTSLHHNINDSIDKDDAVQMLAQHLITEPIFDALFGDYDFVKNNVGSKSLNDIITTLKVFGFEKEQEQLKPFYESVKLRASGIDNAEGKQKLIVTLYDKFFRTGFKNTTDQLGIVFTPVEVVDFIIHSVDDALQKYFGKHLSDKGVHILDPFTGTGTFITRTLQYLKQQMDEGKITFDDILRKYLHELHANEIILLSYYIAAINIEAVFDEVNGPDRGYKPFEGIVLTDTFESTERQNSFMDELLGQNNERLKKQQEKPITAIISNPPYSVGQGSANDDNQNTHYPILERRIEQTYVKKSTSSLSKSSYDSYIKALRWASDRINDKGIIGFVTNGAYIDSGSTDGLRSSLYKEFNHLYVFNLRGNARTQGEQRRKEKDNVFGQGTRTPIAISILVKDGTDKHEIFYHDIGDYLSKKQKLKLIELANDTQGIEWSQIKPDANNDWLNQRDPHYQIYPSIVGEEDSPFLNNAVGISTNRDIWVSGFSKQSVLDNSKRLIDNYNAEVLKNGGQGQKSTMRDSKKIKWSAGLDNQFKKGIKLNFEPQNIRLEMYRPFTKKWLMYDRNIVERPGKYYELWGKDNQVIVTTGRSTNKPFATIVTSVLPDIQLMMNGQGFMRFDHSGKNELLPDPDNINKYFADQLSLNADDAFAYVYALLNSVDYQQRYANDLRKDLARIPIVKNADKYVAIGKQLINLHLNYEEVPVYNNVDIQYKGKLSYKVAKMKFAKKRNSETNKLENDRSTIIFNDSITISNIPDKAYEYIVNGRSAIEWIMDQYRVKTDKKSGITDDPNDYSDDPKYIFNLLLRIINVSVQTVDLINQLPKFEVDESYYKDTKR
ncbi:DEAD/DEAH box helicase [Lactobacillus reuteri]|uniref:type ISP restriction/modification enzyme n=1 Tax=Limosilactobacillus reuteri TaxID=1598 RepID=UPI001469D0B0|nr:type ISP restriction/modification enzyme [Limosilactobacillus reuteri]NMV49677.1 DEAD/DEAH box helicase [Limosilactobacillus reuteri]NMV51355.1 DEAD/DEAH box helicase [Limosilactobacillus reuteri]NMV60037.1 DEAD/DEAH box helicase [Limosilactobacillus reuteri]NMV61589.1 DEAD/DEAH box helicase [Limosilactobacillus reuteri]NMV63597.1 DEAD/DEAH box helicase [Limosilactobacillus reuteri]